MADSIQFSSFGTSPIIILFGIIGLIVYFSYRWTLPHPIPGIPYNQEAAKGLLGDLPAVMKHTSTTHEILSWLPLQNVKLESPIIQVFVRPFSKPWVIISDFRESQDVLMRRTKEFDRSDFFSDVFTGLIPDHHITKKTDSREFKRNRKLLQDLMTPGFLHNVAAPQVYSAAMTLLDLWEEKARLAKNQPFSATSDIYNGALDAIWAVTFGLEQSESVNQVQVQLLSSLKDVAVTKRVGQAVEFPRAPNPPEIDAIYTLTESLETAIQSPLPRLACWCLRQLPYLRRALATKENLISRHIAKAMARLTGQTEKDPMSRCAIDDILRREIALAEKEDRPPMVNSRSIKDELFGLLVAGHDTTSTTFTWGLKLLADHTEAQDTLRSHLRAAYSTALADNRKPTAQEIAKIQIPYLDAVVEEIVRKSVTASAAVRNAVVDTEILGHMIPKGTDVFFLTNGPGYLMPPLAIKEEDRSESCRSAKNRTRSWDTEDMHAFKPERWLVKNEQGDEEFDSLAGPHLIFGAGPRGCFGKRLAYLELRLILVLIIWNFELKKCPEELSSYAATDRLTRQPDQCFVKLAKV